MPEYLVQEVIGRRVKMGKYQWYVIWKREDGTLYPRGCHAWQPKECFIDDEDSDDPIVNEHFLAFELANPGFGEVVPRPFDPERDIKGKRKRRRTT